MIDKAIQKQATATKEKWLVGAFLLALVLYPVPFGGNRGWASATFAVVISLLLLAFVWGGMVRAIPYIKFRKRLVTAAVLIALVILWSLLQITSWTPDSWHHPLWNSFQNLPMSAQGAIALNPGAVPDSLLRMLGYIGCFVLALFSAGNREHAYRILYVLAGAAFVYAAYGIIVESVGLNVVLWYDKWAYRDFLTSTFVNKNSYATYAGMGLLCFLAILWRRLEKKVFAQVRTRDQISERLKLFATGDIFYILGAVIVAGALIMTGSRAGVASAFIGCFVFVAIAITAQRAQWRNLIVLLVIATVLVAILFSGGERLMVRMAGTESDASVRLTAYHLTIEAIKDNPWRGFGLGSFNSAFKLYRDETLPVWFAHAHNDYLEMAMDLGVPAALMLVAALVLLVTCCISGIRHRRQDRIFAILGLSASILVGCHALADFSLQIPAVAATYAALLGLGVAQSISSREFLKYDRDI